MATENINFANSIFTEKFNVIKLSNHHHHSHHHDRRHHRRHNGRLKQLPLVLLKKIQISGKKEGMPDLTGTNFPPLFIFNPSVTRNFLKADVILKSDSHGIHAQRNIQATWLTEFITWHQNTFNITQIITWLLHVKIKQTKLQWDPSSSPHQNVTFLIISYENRVMLHNTIHAVPSITKYKNISSSF